VSWVTFEAAAGGLVVVQLRHIAAIYDEQGEVKLATTAGGVHSLKDITVRRAAAIVSREEDAKTVRPEPL
jgi:cystathionine beta-lyase/cystathionine gamma-synthase